MLFLSNQSDVPLQRSAVDGANDVREPRHWMEWQFVVDQWLLITGKLDVVGSNFDQWIGDSFHGEMTDGCDKPQLRPTIHWKLPEEKNWRAASSCVSAGTAWCQLVGRSSSNSSTTAGRVKRVHWKSSSSVISSIRRKLLLICCCGRNNA